MNKEEKVLTGYPHIDKPWMKYYDLEKAKMTLPKKTLYRYLIDSTKHDLDNVAITYNGESQRYFQFIENIENAAKVLVATDTMNNDRILYLMPNIPETAFLMYAGNKIGAVSDYADPRPDSVDFKVSAKKIFELIKREKINKIIALDQCYLTMLKPIENELNEYGIDNIIIVKATDSLTSKGNFNYIEESIKFNGLSSTIKKLKQMKYLEEKMNEAISKSKIKIIYYKDLLEEIKYVHALELDFKPHKIASITHSSGTSGTFPKAVPLTNEGINSYGFQLSRSNLYSDRGDSYLQILPYFSAYGLSVNHLGFCNADNMIQIPEFVPNNLGKMIKKYKPNLIVGTPNWFLSMQYDKSLKNIDLAFLKTICYGGDSMNPHDEERINNFLSNHGCTQKLTKGHGMSEVSGGSSFAINEYNVPGSMGIPFIDTIYALVDPVTKELIKFKDNDSISGEFIISSPGIVDETLDGNTVIKHGIYDGIDFVYTKDLGTMDKNGVLYFLTRSDRTFTRFDGFKVKPYEIENEIKKLPIIEDCIITPFEDVEKYGKMIKADIIINKEICNNCDEEQIIKDILEQAFINNPNVSSRQIPTKFRICNAFPVTINCKVDYKSLEKESVENYPFSILFDESSVNVGDIQIIKQNNKKLSKKI